MRGEWSPQRVVYVTIRVSSLDQSEVGYEDVHVRICLNGHPTAFLRAQISD